MAARFGRSQAVLRDRLIYIGGAAITFALAATAALLIYDYRDVDASQSLNAQNGSSDNLALGTVVLLAPTSQVDKGVKLNSVILKEIHWPRNEVPEGAVRRAEDLQEMYARESLASNQPILRTSLSSTPILGGVVDLIPAGHRATTIEVDSTSGVEGWATPGAHVDVLVTYHDPQDGQKKSQIAVEDAVVVSFNGQTKNGQSGFDVGKGVNAVATVTLAVPVVEALKIHTARAMGKISLILRNTSDEKQVGPQSITARDLQNSDGTDRSQEEAKGFVRFVDETGQKKQLELRADRRWWVMSENREAAPE